MKTAEDMKLRHFFLRGKLKASDLTLRTAAELDAIENYGFTGWSNFLRKGEIRKSKNRMARRKH